MKPEIPWLIEQAILVCPACHGAVIEDPAGRTLRCTGCDRSYALHDSGTPVLLTEESLFTAEQVLDRSDTYYERKGRESPRKQRIRRSLPSLATDDSPSAVDAIVGAQCSPGMLGLVIGGGERVGSMERRVPEVSWLVSDVDLSYGPGVIADAIALPLSDRRFDVVVAEMVLEHVVNPFRAAAELQRVCKPGGLVVATVPFCFPWHGIPFDFYRCTPSGLRALFDCTEMLHLSPAQLS